MTTFVPRRILVTGGAGFIGSNFVHRCLNRDHEIFVVTIDKLTYAGSEANLAGLSDPERFRFVRGDICDAELVARLLRQYELSAVVHFAAESHVDRSISGPAEFVQTNLLGTFTLLEGCRRYWLEERDWGPGDCRFHHVSTDEVYGSLGRNDPPFEETSQYAPNSPYSATKAGSDHLVRAYFHTYGLPSVTTNCSNNYGPRQHLEKFIPTVIGACIENRPIPVYGDGSNIRDWLYVEDHCSGLEQVLRGGSLGSTYNIGADNEWSNLDIARRICEIMDELRPGSGCSQDLIRLVPDRPGHDWRYAIDSSCVRADLGWCPDVDFDKGLRQTCRWYLQSLRPCGGAND
jgi:dTDP-glucose 4,6-dehydratase